MNSVGYIMKDGSGRVLLPKAEHLLRYLMDNPNRIWPRLHLSLICDFEGHGRACDTYISNIRQCLGQLSFRIVSKCKQGYGWVGDPVELIAVSKAYRPKHAAGSEMINYAIMSQADVAKRLGIPEASVRRIEKVALSKLRLKPELKQAWLELMSFRRRYAYDPFHEVWLFSVQESIPRFQIPEKERAVDRL